MATAKRKTLAAAMKSLGARRQPQGWLITGNQTSYKKRRFKTLAKRYRKRLHEIATPAGSAFYIRTNPSKTATLCQHASEHRTMRKLGINPRRHTPKLRGRGRPGKDRWWRLTLLDGKGKVIHTFIDKGTQVSARAAAKQRVGKKFHFKRVNRTVLDGPFARKPSRRYRAKR